MLLFFVVLILSLKSCDASSSLGYQVPSVSSSSPRVSLDVKFTDDGNQTSLKQPKYHTMPHQCPPPIVNQTRYYCPGGDDDPKNVELIGYLGSFDVSVDGVGILIAGAIPLAVEHVNK
jgi:hypothetical protein